MCIRSFNEFINLIRHALNKLNVAGGRSKIKKQIKLFNIQFEIDD